MEKLVILHMRNGGCFITSLVLDGDDISSLARRLMGGYAVFQDNLWSKKRQLAINLADVSAIEIVEKTV